MGIIYGSGIKLKQTIGFEAKAPLDNRVVVSDIEDLTQITYTYTGLITYVANADCLYIYNDTDGWHPYNTGAITTTDTVDDLNNINTNLLSNGCLAYVNENDTYYKFKDNQWEIAKFNSKHDDIIEDLYKKSTSIPFYDQSKLDIIKDDLTSDDDYIYIGNKDKDIIDGAVSNNTITTTNNGNYVDIMFSALRSLQSEVAKLRNSFNYGIYSYTGKNTAMSTTLKTYDDVIDDEPLWAIEESDLSVIENLEEIALNDMHPLLPTSAVNTDVAGMLSMVNNAVWEDTEDTMLTVTDSKTFAFLTASTVDISIGFINYDEPIIDGKKIIENYDEFGNITYEEIDASVYNYKWLDLSNYSEFLNDAAAYNIQICVSKQTDKKVNSQETNYYGYNYIWLSISNYATNTTLLDGYIDPDTYTLYDTKYDINTRYIIHSIEFGKGVDLTKFNLYSKYQDFSKEILPNKPNDTGYAFKAAHITIRSVEKYDILKEIKDQLPNNELIFIEDTQTLWIKNNETLLQIGSKSAVNPDSGGNDNSSSSSDGTGSSSDNTMDTSTLISKLKELGIIYVNSSTGLELSPVSDITFINQASEKAFKYESDPYGNLVSTEILPENQTLKSRLDKAVKAGAIKGDGVTSGVGKFGTYRGFISQLRKYEYAQEHLSTKQELNDTKDFGLYSDRIKIGAIYAPLVSDTIYGCSHAYIELENTADCDFDLNGCYLHWYGISTITESNSANGNAADTTNDVDAYHLPLTGVIKAGSTYLIRCKQYSDFDNPNTYINVTTYDQEWWVGEPGKKHLLDLTVDYQKDANGEILCAQNAPTTKVYKGYGIALTYSESNCTSKTKLFENNSDENKSNAPYIIHPHLIDAICYSNASYTLLWVKAQYKVQSNSIMKNTFELDPAKQAYQAFTTWESSRAKWAKESNDVQQVDLSNEYISFPHSDEIFAVANYTPKASYENKNVITDKTQIDIDRPNMVTVSYGKNVYTTRCFNWVSIGYFDEYIWLYDTDNDTEKVYKFESYKQLTANEVDNGIRPSRHVFEDTTNHKGFEIVNIIYKRNTGKKFPGSKQPYTIHKCILDILSPVEAEALLYPKTYKYVVGRADKDGNPDIMHTSDVMEFTIYPQTYIPQIYQTSDQQGFHWIEYQVWAAAANAINERIEFDKKYLLEKVQIDAQYVKNTGSIGTPKFELADTDHIPTNFYKFNSILVNRKKSLKIKATYESISYKEILLTSTDTANGTSVYVKNNDTYTPAIYNNADGIQYYKKEFAPKDEYYLINGTKKTNDIKNTGTEANPVYAWNNKPSDINPDNLATTFTVFNTLNIKNYTITLTKYTYITETQEITLSQSDKKIIENVSIDTVTTNNLEKFGYVKYISDTNIEYNIEKTDGNYQITSIEEVNEYSNESENVTYTLTYYRERTDADAHIMPILINTGDMTQNGTRINEWFDYYTGGKNLFNHMEQMNIVGNNDLCNTDVEALGTGDDEGKSNSYFYSLFYCYEVPTMVEHESGKSFDVTPICNNLYIPSLYYFDTRDKRFIIVNSEITTANCENWFNMYCTTEVDGKVLKDPINIYTGWSYPSNGSATSTKYTPNSEKFTSIYTMIYYMLKSANYKGLQVITACHEMPFTVITNSSLLYPGLVEYWRSWNATSAKLIGSHLNQIDANETKAVYWFSRLLEYFHVKLCLGGHKHTYAITYPVRENFFWPVYYTDDNKQTISNEPTDYVIYKSSKDNYDEYIMEDTLANDNVIFDFKDTKNQKAVGESAKHKFKIDGKGIIPQYVNLTKFPLCEDKNYTYNVITANKATLFYPAEQVPELTGGVTYFMLQATGYKLTSNKELPSDTQKFGRMIPQTTTSFNNEAFTDTPAADQKYPMFAIISFNGTEENIKLIRIDGIMNKGAFTQSNYLTSAVKFQYFKERNTDHYIESDYTPYGHWVNYEDNVLVLDYNNVEKALLNAKKQYKTLDNIKANISNIKYSNNGIETELTEDMLKKYKYILN